MSLLRKKLDIDTTAWMVPYGTLMMILMIFFVILYSFSQLGSGIQYERTLATLQSAASGKKLQVLKEAEIANRLEKLFKEANLDKQAVVTINAQKVKIVLTQDVVFDSGSVELKKEAYIALSKLAEVMKDLPNRIIVEGHTDNIPAGKKYSSNWELSALRAFSVIKFLIDNGGLSPFRLAAYGYGEYRPIASNDTPEGRSRNRRIDISILREKVQ